MVTRETIEILTELKELFIEMRQAERTYEIEDYTTLIMFEIDEYVDAINAVMESLHNCATVRLKRLLVGLKDLRGNVHPDEWANYHMAKAKECIVAIEAVEEML